MHNGRTAWFYLRISGKAGNSESSATAREAKTLSQRGLLQLKVKTAPCRKLVQEGSIERLCPLSGRRTQKAAGQKVPRYARFTSKTLSQRGLLQLKVKTAPCRKLVQEGSIERLCPLSGRRTQKGAGQKVPRYARFTSAKHLGIERKTASFPIPDSVARTV